LAAGERLQQFVKSCLRYRKKTKVVVFMGHNVTLVALKMINKDNLLSDAMYCVAPPPLHFNPNIIIHLCAHNFHYTISNLL